LRHFSSASDAGLEASKAAVDVGPLLTRLNANLDTLVRVQEGTLGICFTVRVGARPCFLKSYATDEGRGALEKEITLLGAAYAGRLRVAGIECGNRLWMVMDVLDRPGAAAGVEDVLKTISRYEEHLSPSVHGARMRPDDNMSSLMREADIALERMASRNLIGRDVARQVETHLHRLEQSLKSMSTVVCHGDLGPANLMCNEDGWVAVDWEDAFLGVEGYDFLYWLTFFDNRRHLGDHVFGLTPWPREVDVAMLTMIVLLKCDLSVRAGRVAGNTLTFDQRLGEMLALDRSGVFRAHTDTSGISR
jgi:hypothetical protein